MSSPERLRELRDLLDALCDGRLDESGAAMLRELVCTDDAACRYYVTYLQLHGLLHLSHAQSEPWSSPQTPEGRSIWRRFRWYTLGAAASIFLAALVWWFGFSGSESELRVEDGQLEVSRNEGAWRPARRVVAGEQLRPAGSGDCTIALGAGGQIVLKQGMTGQLLRPEPGGRLRFRIEKGRADFDLPSARNAYLVDTPAGRVRVVGTRFVVEISTERRPGLALWVERGEVQFESDRGSAAVVADQALHCAPDQDPTQSRFRPNDVVFIRSTRHPEFAVPARVERIDGLGVTVDTEPSAVPFERVLAVPLIGAHIEFSPKRDGHYHAATVVALHGQQVEVRVVGSPHSHRIVFDQIRLAWPKH